MLAMTYNPTSTINVLLADDDKDDRYFFERALKDIGHSTNLTAVSDGGRLMDYLSENKGGPPDVIFIDLNMPCKNGMECLSEIKHNKGLKEIPVIIYSTSVREEVADTLYKRGAHYYLQKCNFIDLANSIEGVLTLLAQNSEQPPREQFIINEKEY
jgi:CheY-like chemotaxis protein